MADLSAMAMLGVRLTIAVQTLRLLLSDLDRLEADAQSPTNQKLEEIKKIKLELSKVDEEIDSIKKEITFLKDHRIN